MNYKELIPDAFYAVKYQNEGVEYVFKNTIENNMGRQPHLKIDHSYYSPSGTLNAQHNGGFTDSKYRVATAQEIRHLNACIKAKRWLPLPKSEIINDYEIY